MALTSQLKIFEKVLRKMLVTHIEQNNILLDGQHGSRPLRSTLTQLLGHWNTIMDGLVEGEGVYSV